ncbi:MAG: hypothetical protein ACYCZN_01260 [Candidatus Dormibacteria bacterium]
MRFSVIFTFDLDPHFGRVSDYLPDRPLRHKLKRVEHCAFDSEGVHGMTVHRKYVGLLTREEFESYMGILPYEEVHASTGGSMSPPGFEGQWLPAISFAMGDGQMVGNMYVTPLADVVMVGDRLDRWSPRNWSRVARVVMRKFGAEAWALESRAIL